MVKCMNQQCVNYKQQLEDHLETCPACGQKTEVSESKKIRKEVAGAAFIAAIVGLFLSTRWGAAGIVGPILGVLSVVASFFSRSKAVIIVTILALLLQVVFLFVLDRGFA